MVTKADLWTQLSKGIKIVDDLFTEFSTNLLANMISLEDDYEGNHISETATQLRSLRTKANSIITGGSSFLSPMVKDLGRVGYYSLKTSSVDILQDIADGMTTLSETVKNRAFTFGSVSAYVSNVGDGTVYRLTKDKNNANIENGYANGGITKIKCTSDRYSRRTSGNEAFEIYGVGLTDIDAIELGTAPQAVTAIYALTSRQCTTYITDGSFDTADDSGTLTCSGWDFDVPANFTKEVTDTFRNTPGSSSGIAIKINDNSYLEQNLSDKGKSFDATKPTCIVLRYMRKNSCDGTLTLTLGSKSVTVDLSTATNDVWADLTLGVTDNKGYYGQWFKDDTTIKIALSGATTGEVIVDEIIVTQPTAYDGKYYFVTAGKTDYLKDDYFTFTDSVLNTGRIQYILSRLFGVYLPHTNGTPTWADA